MILDATPTAVYEDLADQTIESLQADQAWEAERDRCAEDIVYFINHYCQIYDGETRGWIPFSLWPEQVETLQVIIENQMTIVLKARQLGLSWLVLAYCLWMMVFEPIATILIFSKRDDEAIYLLGSERLRGMYYHLPAWMRDGEVDVDSRHQFTLPNGSVARAFPNTGGDSYTATFAMVDEADLIPDLAGLMGSVKPTIEAGGKLVLISRVDKSKPNSRFKQIYRAAKQKLNGWAAVFLGWFVRPGRTQEWYEARVAESLNNTGSLDEVYEQYPATDAQALAQKTLDKRIAAAWILRCYEEMQPLRDLEHAPAIPQLEIYKLPEAGREYVIGVDTAEGNPTSDDSAATVLDRESLEECAALVGKIEPTVLGGHVDTLGVFYNMADVMVERNNHGHTVIANLKDHSKLKRLAGWDKKEGWLSNSKGKVLLYNGAADAFRDGVTIMHSFGTYTQMSSIEGSTLRAPDDDHDDRSDSYALAIQGAKVPRRTLRMEALEI